MIRWLRQQAKQLQAEIYALYFVYQDPRVSWVVKALTLGIVAYALSPIDLIPDFIPVLGMLDDLLLLPLGIALVIRLIPAVVLAEARERARHMLETEHPTMRGAAIVIIGIWIAIAILVATTVLPWVSRHG
jgi:uncharacterized membrane protein YkvA (DUF1232 family)